MVLFYERGHGAIVSPTGNIDMASNLRMAGHHLIIGKGTDAFGSDLSIHGSVAIDYQLIITKEVTLTDHSYVMVDTALAAGNVTVRLPAAELHPRRI